MLKIVNMEIFPIKIPLKGSFTTSFGKALEKHALIIKLTTLETHSRKNITGWGEAPTDKEPRYSGEFLSGSKMFLENILKKYLIGLEFDGLEDIHQRLNTFRGNNMAKAGVEFAAADALARWQDQQLVEFLWENALKQPPTRKKIPVGISLGIPDSRDPIDLVNSVKEAVSRGYHKIKIKIEPGWDVKPLKAIREQYPDLPLMVDGNGGYTKEKHLDHLTKLDEFELLMIEQPFPEDAFLDHATLQKEISTPICLDESLKTPRLVELALELEAMRIINLKPARVGGVINSLSIHSLAQKYHVPAWIGGMLETGIGRAFNVAMATLPGFTIPGDISETARYFNDDIIPHAFQLDENGMLEVPTIEKGLGITIDESRLSHFIMTG